MRHLKSYKNLGRETAHRMAMLRNLATSFVCEGRVKTTLARAKALRPFVERLITLSKKDNLSSRRKAASVFYTHEARKKLFDAFGNRFKERAGGYTRIIKYGARFGDGAQMCSLELVDFSQEEGKLKQQVRQDLQKKKKEKQEKEAAEASAPAATKAN